jgi:hypothetical protein
LGFNGVTTPDLHSMQPNGTSQVIDLRDGNVTTAQVTYFGLPVVGFAAETFQNDAITVNGKTFLSTFGVTFPHHFGRVVQ